MCLVSQKQPKIVIKDQSLTQVSHPHRHFHADVIRRERQYILLLTDSFSTFSSAMLIESERAEHLRAGLIILTNNVRHPGPITVTTDSAVGFASLARGDKQLTDLDIIVQTRDEFNKNYNVVVDHVC